MLNKAWDYIKDESGVTAIEYAIIGVAVSVIMLAAFAQDAALPTALSNALTTIEANITAAGN